MTLDELYLQKGRLTTQIEVAQAQLAHTNQELAAALNKATEVPTEIPVVAQTQEIDEADPDGPSE